MKGFEIVPVFLSSRIIFMIMFVSSLFLFETFSASYTSFLSGGSSSPPHLPPPLIYHFLFTVIEMRKPFSDLTELEATNFKIGSFDSGAVQSIFMVSKFWSENLRTYHFKNPMRV